MPKRAALPHSRRHFLQGSLAAAGLGLFTGCGVPLTPWAQPARAHRVGYLGLGSSGPNPGVEAFQRGLRDLGYVEGRNVVVEYRLADGLADRLPTFAAELL